MTKKELIQQWKAKISTCDTWAFRAALRLVELQTQEERNIRGTVESNGVGLNAFDAEFVTDVINQHMSGKRLSRSQLLSLRRIMPKYAAQLVRIVYGKDASLPG